MKTATLTLCPLILSLSILSATAQLYWDSDGVTPGAGGSTPAGTWGTDAFWSTSANGDATTGVWTDGNAAVFTAGTDATGTYTVTVNGTQMPAAINFEEGTVTLSGGTLDMSSGPVIDVASGLTATIGSAFSGSAFVSKTGAGALVLSDPSLAYTPAAPGFSVVQGTLQMGASGDILANAPVTLSGGTTLDLKDLSVGIGSLAGTGGSVLLGSGTLTNLGIGANTLFSGSISGSGGLTKAGANNLRLNGTSTFTGKTVILGGLLLIESDSALGTPPGAYVADQVAIDGGTLHLNQNLEIPANRGIYVGPNGGTISVASSKSPTNYASITGPGGLIKTGTGNISLYSTNTFAGDFTILAAGVRFNSDASAGTGRIILSPQASIFLRNLDVPGHASTVTNAMTVNPATGFFIDLNAAVRNGVPEMITFSGPISGTGPLLRGQQAGSSGYVILSGDNSGWSGGLTLWRGKLGLGHKNALGTTPLLISPATFTAGSEAVLLASTPLTGAAAVVTAVNINITNTTAHFSFGGTNALELSGAVDLGPTITPVITVTNTGGTFLSGPIGGGAGVGLTKEGGDTLTLSGANTYPGVTTVNAGALLVNSPGSLAGGGVVVKSGGTLGGSGTVIGTVTVNSGGSVGAGSSAGSLTLANGLDLSAGGTNVWELAANSTSNPGTDFDRIILTSGSLTLGGSATLKILFTGGATAPDSSNPFWQSARSWTIISATGAASNFAAIENGTYPAGTFTTSVAAGGIVLTFAPSAGPTPVTSFSIATGPGSDLTLRYSGGSGSQFVLLQTNKVAAPLGLWTRVKTNATSPGSFIITPGSDPQGFYRVQVQ